MSARRQALAGYELEHRLGEGGAGTVWRARQLSSLGRPVALKRVRVPSGAAELRTEAGILVELDHPHIVRVFELVPDGDDGVAIAMQLAGGGSLDERLARRGPLPPHEVVAIMRKLAAALGSAHRRGVLHRDVKPGNVLFTSDGEPLLADFGIAAWADDGLVRGTAAYLDPSVLAGRPPDASSDLYALGAVAREMLGGVLDGAPEPLASVVERCLAADPTDRFSCAEDVEAALDAPPTPRSTGGPSPLRDDPGVTRTFGPRPPAAPVDVRSSTPWRAAVALAGFALVVAGTVVASRAGGDDPRAASAMSTTTAATRSCPAVTPGPADLVGDVDGDGCADVVARAGNVVTVGDRRYEVGAADDVIVLGDWDCDGRATPAAYRSATGEAHLFDGWAGPDRPLPSVRRVAADTPPSADC